jgi:hypothetical protein
MDSLSNTQCIKVSRKTKKPMRKQKALKDSVVVILLLEAIKQHFQYLTVRFKS